MPSRSFFEVPDQFANRVILLDYHPNSDMPDIEQFVARGLAPLVDEASLARLVGISTQTVFNMTRRVEKHYLKFKVEKKSGGYRDVSSPRTYLKVVQWWLLDNILSKLTFENCVTGFVPGMGPYRNAQIHSGANHILNVDLKDFFPSVTSEMVKRTWLALGYNSVVAQQLTDLTTFEGCLPQGAPTSPSLSNLACLNMDLQLAELARVRGYKFTRYADDVTFSSYSFLPLELVSDISAVCLENGFMLNGKKTRFRGRGGAMQITGFVVNGRTQLPRQWRKRARAIFYQATKNPELFVHRINVVGGYFGMLCSFSDVGDPLRASGQVALDILVKMRKSLIHAE